MHLAVRGVLKFVDEQMANFIVEIQSKVSGARFIPQPCASAKL